MPSTMASVLRTCCVPAGPGISATSSSSPRASGAASGAKKRAMRSNSPRLGIAIAGIPGETLLRPQCAGDAIEHAVHHARLLTVVEGARDLDVFVDDDGTRHVDARQQLVGS